MARSTPQAIADLMTTTGGHTLCLHTKSILEFGKFGLFSKKNTSGWMSNMCFSFQNVSLVRFNGPNPNLDQTMSSSIWGGLKVNQHQHTPWLSHSETYDYILGLGPNSPKTTFFIFWSTAITWTNRSNNIFLFPQLETGPIIRILTYLSALEKWWHNLEREMSCCAQYGVQSEDWGKVGYFGALPVTWAGGWCFHRWLWSHLGRQLQKKSLPESVEQLSSSHHTSTHSPRTHAQAFRHGDKDPVVRGHLKLAMVLQESVFKHALHVCGNRVTVQWTCLYWYTLLWAINFNQTAL